MWVRLSIDENLLVGVIYRLLAQSTFAYLALSNREWYPPAGFWKAFKDYDGEPLNVREHQDAYEFFTRLQVRPCLLILKPACTAPITQEPQPTHMQACAVLDLAIHELDHTG